MYRWFKNDILFKTIVLLIFLSYIRTENQCVFDPTISTLSSGMVYIDYGYPIELYCIQNSYNVHKGTSESFYFTRDMELISDTVQILNSSAVKLHIEYPPKQKSLYSCRSQNYTEQICWKVIVVDSKPSYANDLVCVNYGHENFGCSWTRPESFASITFNVTYYLLNKNLELKQYQCPNLIYYENSRRMSCRWALPSDSHLFLYFRLNMTNYFGTTVMNRVVIDFQYAPFGQPRDNSCVSKYIVKIQCLRSSLITLLLKYVQDLQHSSSVIIEQPQPPQPIVDRNSQYKVICNIHKTARKRVGIGKFSPNNIDPDLCTHIIVLSATLDENTWNFEIDDAVSDNDREFYKEVTAYRSKGVKVLLGFVGWPDSGKEKYSRLVNTPIARKQFITNAIDYLEKNNFDGFQWQWFFPKCWQGDCSRGPDSEKSNFATFIKEMHDAFEPKGMLLSALVPAQKVYIDSGFDVPTLSRYLDWVAVYSVNFHGNWQKSTGQLAPLYIDDVDKDREAYVDFSIRYWIEHGADRRKILMGLPAFGEKFYLVNNQYNGLYAQSTGEGSEPTYYQICEIIDGNWTIVHDHKRRMGPYAYFENQWISFDDFSIIRYKAEYIRDMNLGGAMLVSMDGDDFGNVCGCGNYPLLKTVNRVLRNYIGPMPNCRLFIENQSNREHPIHEAIVF